MKTINKEALIKCKNSEKVRANVFAERNILALIKHPFICNLHFAFQDRYFLYLIMDVALGGDLRYQLSKCPDGFPEERAKFYIGQVILALEFLHIQTIIHRDIKPANILMDETGYVKLSDFGLSRRIPTGVCCEGGGTRGYIAPEIYRNHKRKHTFAAEWFSLGVVLYEFFTMKRPYKEETIKKKHFEHYDKAEKLKNDPTYIKLEGLDHVSVEARQFIQGLLIFNPKYRLGSTGSDELKQHPWFNGFSFDDLFNRKYTPTFKPDINVANCNGNFDVTEYFEGDGNSNKTEIPPESQHLFDGYEYNVEIKQKQSQQQQQLMEQQSSNHLRKSNKEKENNLPLTKRKSRFSNFYPSKRLSEQQTRRRITAEDQIEHPVIQVQHAPPLARPSCVPAEFGKIVNLIQDEDGQSKCGDYYNNGNAPPSECNSMIEKDEEGEYANNPDSCYDLGSTRRSYNYNTIHVNPSLPNSSRQFQVSPTHQQLQMNGDGYVPPQIIPAVKPYNCGVVITEEATPGENGSDLVVTDIENDNFEESKVEEDQNVVDCP